MILSDMRQHTLDLDLETKMPDFASIKNGLTFPELEGIDVFVLGADGSGKNIGYWNALQAFWKQYFHAAKATLQSYSGLRETKAVQ